MQSAASSSARVDLHQPAAGRRNQPDTPKTQAALLEAMAERQVSIDGSTHRLPQPFIVLATDNPIEYEGTYPLPRRSWTGSRSGSNCAICLRATRPPCCAAA